jgi:hypothetical protein
VSIILVLVTLALGIRQLTGIAVGRFRAGQDLGRKLKVVEALLAQREYPAAWKVLAVTADSAATQDMRERLASAWLLNASTIGSNMSLSELAKELSPSIASLVGSGSARERAERQSLLAFSQYLRSHDEPVAGDIAKLYRQALEYDEECTLGHVLLGHYLVSRRDDVDEGIRHLDRALELEQMGRPRYISALEWKWTALHNLARSVHRSYSGEIDPAGKWWKAQLTILEAANRARLNGRSLLREVDARRVGPDRSNDFIELVEQIYRVGNEDGGLALLRAALPEQEHLKLIEWLEGQGAESVGMAFLRATLHASRNEAELALSSLRAVEPGYAWKKSFDQLHQELTGEPFGDLADRDPWAYRAQVLGRGRGDSAEEVREYDLALEAVDEYMGGHRTGFRLDVGEALASVRAARKSMPKQGDDRRTRFDLYMAELLFSIGQLDEARAQLETLRAALPRGHPLRARSLIEEAAVRASIASASATNSDDDQAHSAAVALLASAVEEEGWADWAWIRWRAPFRPLHARRDYAALLERHGRKAGGPAGIEWQYDDE